VARYDATDVQDTRRSPTRGWRGGAVRDLGGSPPRQGVLIPQTGGWWRRRCPRGVHDHHETSGQSRCCWRSRPRGETRRGHDVVWSSRLRYPARRKEGQLRCTGARRPGGPFAAAGRERHGTALRVLLFPAQQRLVGRRMTRGWGQPRPRWRPRPGGCAARRGGALTRRHLRARRAGGWGARFPLAHGTVSA